MLYMKYFKITKVVVYIIITRRIESRRIEQNQKKKKAERKTSAR